MCTVSGFTKTSDVLKTLHTITQFHLHIFINQKALCRRHHTHTNRQLIFTKASYKINKYTLCFVSIYTYTYTFKQFCLHIHEAYSRTYLKDQDFNGFYSNIKYVFKLLTCKPTNQANSSTLSHVFIYLIIIVAKHCGTMISCMEEGKQVPTQAITCTLTQWGTAAFPR